MEELGEVHNARGIGVVKLDAAGGGEERGRQALSTFL
jgi:hypothetical protein